ncbi:hypothetical protein HanRHA438_Chr09g0414931 [Helianthus annuus]|nr:hypothetical protein HanRHA438_Chr09g0414931 [Helianthus annuus]
MSHNYPPPSAATTHPTTISRHHPPPPPSASTTHHRAPATVFKPASTLLQIYINKIILLSQI